MEQIYKGEYTVAPSVFTHKQQEDFMKGYDGNSPELAYRVKGGQLSYLQEARDASKAQLKGIRPVKWNSETDDPG